MSNANHVIDVTLTNGEEISIFRVNGYLVGVDGSHLDQFDQEIYYEPIEGSPIVLFDDRLVSDQEIPAKHNIVEPNNYNFIFCDGDLLNELTNHNEGDDFQKIIDYIIDTGSTYELQTFKELNYNPLSLAKQVEIFGNYVILTDEHYQKLLEI